jgi:predicted phosphodiesterase
VQVAVLSDIHGHLPALEAVSAEVDQAAVDRIVLTGDIAAGPMPVPTLQRLLDLGDRAVWVRGNGDRYLVTVPEAPPDPVVPWAAAQLTAELPAHLAGLPLTVTLDIDGLGSTLFCHATPRDDEEIALVDSTLDRWAEVLAGRPEQTVVLGHTHMPFVRLASRSSGTRPTPLTRPCGVSARVRRRTFSQMDSEPDPGGQWRTSADGQPLATEVAPSRSTEDSRAMRARADKR